MDSPQNVSLTLSLNGNDAKLARYTGSIENGVTITLYLSAIWQAACEEEKRFLNILIESYLFERICIERGFQNIKTKGGRCNPCCVSGTVIAMADHIYEDDIEW